MVWSDAPEYSPRVGIRSVLSDVKVRGWSGLYGHTLALISDPDSDFGLGSGSVRARARARNAPAVLVADHRPILPRDGFIGAQAAQCVVRVVVVVPVLMAAVPAPAL